MKRHWFLLDTFLIKCFSWCHFENNSNMGLFCDADSRLALTNDILRSIVINNWHNYLKPSFGVLIIYISFRWVAYKLMIFQLNEAIWQSIDDIIYWSGNVIRSQHAPRCLITTALSPRPEQLFCIRVVRYTISIIQIMNYGLSE